LLALGACSGTTAAPTAHVGIVIGTADTDGGDLRAVYDWAFEAVNEGGGPGGRRLEARYFVMDDVTLASAKAQEDLAAAMLSDPDLVAVAGLFSFNIAPKLVAAGVPYITPNTGDDDVFRGFHSGGFVWRTLESDSTLMWLLLAEAKRAAVTAQKATATVGLLTATDPYGATFFEWYGFHALELGLTAYPPVQFDQDNERCEPAVDRLLAQGVPDVLIAVPSGIDPVGQAKCIVAALKSRTASSKILFADSVHVPELLTALGADGEGIVGFDDAPDPDSGFVDAFTLRTHLPLPERAANAFDAIALLAYGLEQSGGEGRGALEQGMRAVVDGDGPATRWDAQGIQQALSLIRQGQHPDIAGASGPLRFDKAVYTDPLATFFERWTIEGGVMRTTAYVTTASEGSSTAVSQSAITRALKTGTSDKLASGGGSPDLPARHENWALVAATSGTWANYRHQADALAHYRALKANGFDDQHIVLVMEDDLADATENVRKGEVINAPEGPNVHADAFSDYKGKSLNASQLMGILSGASDPNLPSVLHSKADDNVYVFLVGHGGSEGPYVGMDERSQSNVDEEHFVAPALFANTVAVMHGKHQFRRMLIAVDACHAGVLGPALEGLKIPDVILLTSAAEAETSFSTNYATQLKAWTADQFSYELVQRVGRSPSANIDDLYKQLYEGVVGSHVQVFNEASFGDAAAITLDEFVVPKRE